MDIYLNNLLILNLFISLAMPLRALPTPYPFTLALQPSHRAYANKIAAAKQGLSEAKQPNPLLCSPPIGLMLLFYLCGRKIAAAVS
jgi:hypothetical protein